MCSPAPCSGEFSHCCPLCDTKKLSSVKRQICMDHIQMVEGHLVLFTGWATWWLVFQHELFIHFVLPVLCSATLLPLLSFFTSLKYLELLIFLLKCELTGTIDIWLGLIRLVPTEMCFVHCKQQQKELGALGKG